MEVRDIIQETPFTNTTEHKKEKKILIIKRVGRCTHLF